MKGIPTFRAALGALIVVALCFAAAGAFAQTKFTTRLTLNLNRSTEGDVITGKVKSNAQACEKKRKVKLHHRAVSEQEPSSVVATVRTNSKGKWKYTPKKNDNGDRFAAAGNYTVKAGEVKLHGDDGGITCKQRNSSSMFIG